VTRIAIDPVTRIEGHLRIEATVEGGKVADAWSSSTMFRGMEIVLRNRDSREAWLFAQRICGVCTLVHGIASVRAVEDALTRGVGDLNAVFNLQGAVRHNHTGVCNCRPIRYDGTGLALR